MLRNVSEGTSGRYYGRDDGRTVRGNGQAVVQSYLVGNTMGKEYVDDTIRGCDLLSRDDEWRDEMKLSEISARHKSER